MKGLTHGKIRRKSSSDHRRKLWHRSRDSQALQGERRASRHSQARSTASFEKAKKELNHSFDIIQTDVSQLKDLDRLDDHIKNAYGSLDVLFANEASPCSAHGRGRSRAL